MRIGNGQWGMESTRGRHRAPKWAPRYIGCRPSIAHSRLPIPTLPVSRSLHAALLGAAVLVLPAASVAGQQYIVGINRALDISSTVPGDDMGAGGGSRASFLFVGRSGRWGLGLDWSQHTFRGQVAEPPADASSADLIVRPTLVMGSARFLAPAGRATLVVGADVGTGVATLRMDNGSETDRETVSGLAFAPTAALRFPLNEQLSLEVEGRYERLNLGDDYVQFERTGYRVRETASMSWVGVSLGVMYRFAR